MRTRRACAGWMLVVVLVLGAGCSQAPSRSVAGAVVPEDSEIRVGSTVPDIEFRDASGDLHRLSSVYEDATLIVFVEEVCGKPTRELLEAEETLRGRGALVRIYTGSCPSEAECLHVLESGDDHMISLCDRKRILARRYGISGGSAVFLVDRYGRVKASGGLSDLSPLTRSAEKMALAEAANRERLYGGN